MRSDIILLTAWGKKLRRGNRVNNWVIGTVLSPAAHMLCSYRLGACVQARPGSTWHLSVVVFGGEKKKKERNSAVQKEKNI